MVYARTSSDIGGSEDHPAGQLPCNSQQISKYSVRQQNAGFSEAKPCRIHLQKSIACMEFDHASTAFTIVAAGQQRLDTLGRHALHEPQSHHECLTHLSVRINLLHMRRSRKPGARNIRTESRFILPSDTVYMPGRTWTNWPPVSVSPVDEIVHALLIRM